MHAGNEAPDAVPPRQHEETVDSSVPDIPDEDDEAADENASEASGDEDEDRWAGTMSGEWVNERKDTPAPAAAAARIREPEKPVPALEDVLGKIPAEAREILKDEFKTDFKVVRPYPSGS